MQIFKYIHKKTNKCVNRKWKYELFQIWVVQKRSKHFDFQVNPCKQKCIIGSPSK